MNAQDTIFDEMTRKQLIWYGHDERMNPTRLPKIMINPLNTKLNPICHLLALLGIHHILHISRIRVNWKPEGREKRGRLRRTWKDGMYTAMSERDLKMGEWNNRRQWNVAVGRRHQLF
jgi:hypothetical protein